jgi:hypothetical protein
MEARTKNRPGSVRQVALPYGASSEAPDQEPHPDRADAHDRPFSEAGVGLLVLFLVIVIVQVVEDPGSQKEV